MKLRDLGEFELLARLFPDRISAASDVRRGIGEDCSVIARGDGWLDLVTTDMLVEDVHFLRERISPKQLGAKALAVNLSDIAAMGGEPRHAYISVALPSELEVEEVEALFDGIKEQAQAHGVELLGGDTTRSPGPLVLSIAVVGQVGERDVLYRDGAQPGDQLFVSGYLGDAAAGLHALLSADATIPAAETLITRHQAPAPHLAAGRALGKSGQARAMIDLSDGLAGDLHHLCEANALGALIHLDALPLSSELRRYAEEQGLDPFQQALVGGEDYVLLVAGDADLPEALGSALPLYPIGALDDAPGIRTLRDGTEKELDVRSWDHFKDGR